MVNSRNIKIEGVAMNKAEPYFLNDKLIISDDVKKMSKEQLRQEIMRLEKETKEKGM